VTWPAPGSSGVCPASAVRKAAAALSSWRTWPKVKQPVHAAVAQQVHVVDGVRAGDHPGHQRRHLDRGVDSALGLQGQLVGDQITQPAGLREGHHRRQAAGGHEIRIIERRRQRRRTVRQSHPADALLW
jgi:hypothetical protein